MVKPTFTAGESERYKSERGEFAKMDVGQLPALLQQQAQFFQQTVEQQTNTLAQAMNAMADMVRSRSGEGERAHDDQACLHDAAELLWQG